MNSFQRKREIYLWAYHCVSWLRALCCPPRALQSRGSPVGSESHCEALVSRAALHGGNSVPALLAALVAPPLSSAPVMKEEE